jgi:hypothetical protein
MDSLSIRGNLKGMLTELTPVPNPDVSLAVNGSFNLPFQ